MMWKKLEKNKHFWFLFSFSFLFFLLRFPSLFEPYWYKDESIYQVIGMALTHGRVLYETIWDNKPPLLYALYAVTQGDQFSIRLLSLLFGLGSLYTFYLLSKKLFGTHFVSIYVTASLFTFLFATPYLEGNIANAENFMLLPILLAAVLIIHTVPLLLSKHEQQTTIRRLTLPTSSVYLFVAGLLLGLAFLIKTVALFDFVSFFLFLGIVTYTRYAKLVFNIKKLLFLPLGFVLPFGIFLILCLFQGNISSFFSSAFISNFGYINLGNHFVIPQGLLLTKIVCLGLFSYAIFIKRSVISLRVLFVVLWLAFGIFSTFFSQRPYIHYLLVIIPSFSLLAGLIFLHKKTFFVYLISACVLSIFLMRNFPVYEKMPQYYTHFVSFLSGRETTDSYQTFFDKQTPQDYQLAQFLHMHMKPQDQFFLWGDNAAVYVLTQTLPIGKYIVTYHMTATQETLEDTYTALQKTQPRFIVIMENQPPFPYSLSSYAQRFTLAHAIIYEKVF